MSAFVKRCPPHDTKYVNRGDGWLRCPKCGTQIVRAPQGDSGKGKKK